LNNKISFVKFIPYNWQFKVMTAGSARAKQPSVQGSTLSTDRHSVN